MNHIKPLFVEPQPEESPIPPTTHLHTVVLYFQWGMAKIEISTLKSSNHPGNVMGFEHDYSCVSRWQRGEEILP